MGLSITPVSFGTTEFDRSQLMYMAKPGEEKIDIPFLGYVISGGDKTIVVDTGPPDPDHCREHQRPIVRREGQEPEAALRAAGFPPETIDLVVISHLHWDHCGNNHLFPNATFVVQREELRYAAAPLPVHIRGYQSTETGLDPLWRGTRFTILDGDDELADGVRVIHTPGHSPGSQCVVVEGERDLYVIAQDMVPLFANWEGVSPYSDHVPNAIHVDLTPYYESFKAIERAGDFILPGHDPSVLEKDVYQ